MNLIKNIFIIYIIFLAVYPCTDKYSVVFENSLQNKTSLQHNISQDIENDFCNPFCICNCDRQITLISLEIESFLILGFFHVKTWENPRENPKEQMSTKRNFLTKYLIKSSVKVIKF